jgi:tRNA A-37 threonylcarbamoyl transferase component Bud32
VPSLAGTQIDKYDLIEEVGHGGMAVVYRGLDRVLKREVAVKVLHPHLADRQESRLRLEREAIAVAKLRHENILEIFDYSGPDAEASYIVTEFIHGVTLKQWVDERLVPRPAVAALIVHRLCSALEHAHRTGIVHRDIKPENVMIREDGVLKLMDFGIAQIIDNQKLTLTGQLIGSPAYMAPELISGRPLDHRTDLFSVGILLYQLATGELPFSGRNPHEVLNRIADGKYPLAASLCPLVDRDLEDIIALALASDPDERYQTVETFGTDLARYLEEVGVEPSNAELGRYFREPEDYVVELDQRVCASLTERAKTAVAEGDTARAIRQLGRVLELDAGHPGAIELLARLRQRERRNRRFLMVAASLGTLAAVVGIAQLVPRGEPQSEGLAAVPHAAAHDRVGSGSLAAQVEDTTGDRDPDPALAVSSSSDGSTEDTATELASTDTGPAAFDPTRPGDKIKRKNTPAVPEAEAEVTTPCRLAFTGIPLPTAQNLVVKVGNESHHIEAMQMDVEFAGLATAVRVSDKRYSASRKITAAECEAGPVTVEINPMAARVKFEGPPADAVVVCKAGCLPSLIGTNQTAKDFRPVPIVDGTLQPVTLVLKHIDYEPITIDEDLVPGPQTIRVAMVPRVP